MHYFRFRCVSRIFNYDKPHKVIGTRHGEKLYETLLSREEMARAEDYGNVYRLLRYRDLNYDKFFIDGETKISNSNEYNSHNTKKT